MIQQIQQQISNLNRAYFEGSLSYGDYKKTRGLMLDGLFDDVTVTEENAPATVPMQSKSAPATSHAATSGKSKNASNSTIYVAIGVLVIAVVIAVAFLLTGNDKQTSAPTTAANQAYTQPNIESLVKESLNSAQWTPARIDQITSMWQNLSTVEKSKAQSSRWHAQLNDALTNLANEQKALIDLGNQNAIAFEAKITQLQHAINQ